MKRSNSNNPNGKAQRGGGAVIKIDEKRYS